MGPRTRLQLVLTAHRARPELETLALHIDAQRRAGAVFRFESSWKKPYSGHATHQSLEIYSRLALADAPQRYDEVIGDFPT